MTTTKRAGDWLTPNDVGNLVGVTSETIRRWVREDRLTPTTRTVGGQLRWRLIDAERQLADLIGYTPEVPETPEAGVDDLSAFYAPDEDA